jgi:23S rRNA (adenine2030-N6)-methyltransferase
MNYKHAFHAGNHTEVFKHSVLCLLLLELLKKQKPFTVIDTHAGAGLYDLRSAEPQKTGEAQDGVGIVLGKDIPTAVAYLQIVRKFNPNGLSCYSGSPVISQQFLRKDDRLIACELRTDDAVHLRKLFKKDPRVAVHHRNGYQAVKAFVPPSTRRGLVFIDPPFEQRDEFEQVANALNAGIHKWPTGIFLAWYPLKDRSGIRTLRGHYLPSNPPTLCCEFLRQPLNRTTLAGSGLVLCNPPWEFETKLNALCRDLLKAFDASDGRYTTDWWIRDR